MLDYDFERVQFTKIMGGKEANVAIDTDGEIWYIGGLVNKDSYKNPVQVKANFSKNSVRYIDRPICSNLMRQANKFALKISVGTKHVAVLARDKLTGDIGVDLLFSRA